jgi:hypothetical protein
MTHNQRGAEALLPLRTEVFSRHAQSFGRDLRFLTIKRHDRPAGHNPRHQRVGNIRDAWAEIDKGRHVL